MPKFVLLFKITPAALFGLPDGEKLVIPTGEGSREVIGPAIDRLTGHIVSHGTLSEYRSDKSALQSYITLPHATLAFTDNFLRVHIDAENAKQAASEGNSIVEKVCQSLSALVRQRVAATSLSIEDEAGNARRLDINSSPLQWMHVTMYNLTDLADKLRQAAIWVAHADELVEKALFYFEHACLLDEFSRTLPFLSSHASLSRAVAFLQLYKALTTIIGDPSMDKDYQSRFRRLGLPENFWKERVRPLYQVRNDSDVAHYTKSMPEPQAYHQAYADASQVFVEVIEAYVQRRLT